VSFSAHEKFSTYSSEYASGFSGLAASHLAHLLRLVTKAMSDRLLARIIHERRRETFEAESRRGFSM
jgi:hypothetical protein